MKYRSNWNYLVNSNNGDYIVYNLQLSVDNLQSGYLLHIVNKFAIIDGETTEISKPELYPIKLSQYQFENIKGFIPIRQRNLSLGFKVNKYNKDILTIIPKDKTLAHFREERINAILSNKKPKK
jgi:hypothetical protein